MALVIVWIDQLGVCRESHRRRFGHGACGWPIRRCNSGGCPWVVESRKLVLKTPGDAGQSQNLAKKLIEVKK